MILTDIAINELSSKAGMIAPYRVENCQPCSYDLTLDDTFMRLVKVGNVDPTEKPTYIYEKVDRKNLGEDFLIMPGEFILATTKETVKLPADIAGQIQGKSSIGRIGLFIHNAGHIDPGFHGQITLELYNASPNPIKLNFVDRICQIVFTRTTGSVANSYHGKYQNQQDVTGSRIDWEYLDPPNVGKKH